VTHASVSTPREQQKIAPSPTSAYVPGGMSSTRTTHTPGFGKNSANYVISAQDLNQRKGKKI